MTDFSRQGRASRRKGSVGELAVRDLLREHGWTDAHRNFMSGGAGGGDLADAIPDWHIEVKNTRQLDLNGAWRQADRDENRVSAAAVAHHGPYQPWLGTVLLMDILEFGLYGWSPQVLSLRQSVRAEFMGRLRVHAHPLMLHTVRGEAVCTALLSDVLSLIRLSEGRVWVEGAA